MIELTSAVTLMFFTIRSISAQRSITAAGQRSIISAVLVMLFPLAQAITQSRPRQPQFQCTLPRTGEARLAMEHPSSVQAAQLRVLLPRIDMHCDLSAILPLEAPGQKQ